jgi:cytochrome P450
VLIRRALTADVLPKGGGEAPVTLPKGTDVFISTWNLHRSPALWDEPEVYNPKRFFKKFENAQVEGWAGFDPSRASGLYPNEVRSVIIFATLAFMV